MPCITTQGIVGGLEINRSPAREISIMPTFRHLPARALLLGAALLCAACHNASRITSANQLYAKAASFAHDGHIERARATYDELATTYQKDATDPAVLRLVCASLSNLQSSLAADSASTGEQAIHAADRVISTCSTDARPELRRYTAQAMAAKADALDQKLHQIPQSIAIKRQLIDTYAGDADAGTRKAVQFTMLSLAAIIDTPDRNNPETAALMKRAISTYASDTMTAMVERRCLALGIQSMDANRHDDLAAAEASLQQLKKSCPPDETTIIHDTVRDGLKLLARIHASQKDYATARGEYEHLIKAYASDKYPESTTDLAKWLTSLSVMQTFLKQPEQAAATNSRLVKACAPGENPTVRGLVAGTMVSLAEHAMNQKRYDAATTMLNDVIRTYSPDTDASVRYWTANAWLYQGLVQGRLNHTQDAIANYQHVVNFYGADTSALTKKTVALALDYAADIHLFLAKTTWHHRAHAHAELQAALNDLYASLSAQPDNSFALSSLAYVQWLLGDPQTATATFVKSLNTGDDVAAAYKDTLNAIAQNPIPEDNAFQAMVKQQRAINGTRHADHI